MSTGGENESSFLIKVFIGHSVSSVGAVPAVNSEQCAKVLVSARVSASEMRQVLHTLLDEQQERVPGMVVALRDLSQTTPTVVPLSALHRASAELLNGPFGLVLSKTLPEAEMEEYNHYRVQQMLRPHLRRRVTLDLDTTNDNINVDDDQDEHNDTGIVSGGGGAAAAVDLLNVSTNSSGTSTTFASTGANTTTTAIGNAAHVIELSVVRIGTWEVVSKMKGELTLIIDEEKSVIQYRWRKPNLKKQTFATFVIQFAISLLLSAHVNESGSIADVVDADGGDSTNVANAAESGGKRKQMCDSEPQFRIDWLLELSGPPVFFKSDDKPLKKTTERLKSVSALADVKSRRSEGAAPDWSEIGDFTNNEQATTYRRHVCVVSLRARFSFRSRKNSVSDILLFAQAVGKSGAQLSRLLAGKPYLSNLNQLQLFPMPGQSGMTFGVKKP